MGKSDELRRFCLHLSRAPYMSCQTLKFTVCCMDTLMKPKGVVMYQSHLYTWQNGVSGACTSSDTDPSAPACLRYILYGDVSAKVAEELRKPEVGPQTYFSLEYHQGERHYGHACRVHMWAKYAQPPCSLV